MNPIVRPVAKTLEAAVLSSNYLRLVLRGIADARTTLACAARRGIRVGATAV